MGALAGSGIGILAQAGEAALASGSAAAAAEEASGAIIYVDSAGEANAVINGVEMSIHATEQASVRGIILSDIEAAITEGTQISYIQEGQAMTGYYDAVTNLFVGVGQRITTVLNPTNPANYLANLVSRGL